MTVENLKKCSKCGEEKPVTSFHLNKTKVDGRNSYCKECIAAYKKNYKLENSEIIKIKDKKYSEVSRDKINARRKQWREKNHEKEKEKSRNRYHANREKIKEDREKNKEKTNGKMKKLMHQPCHSKFYLKNLPPSDNAIMENGNIKVRCKTCGKMFMPEYLMVRNRSLSFRGMAVTGENNFYCSDRCKNNCPVFGYNPNSYGVKKIISKKINKARSCQTKTLKQLQCDQNNGQSFCEKCGDFCVPDLHHTLPVAQFAKDAINPASHILLCAGCHVELHRVCA